MKRVFYTTISMAFAMLLLQACDNGNADVTIFDSPPRVELVKPVNFTSPDFKLKLKFYDGAEPSISSSPLASATYEIKKEDGTVASSGSLAVSGVFTEINQPISLAAGKYTLKVSGLDTNGNKAESESNFVVLASVGIIGDATSGGWGSDTNLTVSATEADVYTMTIALTSGAVKFRANDDWAINWGAANFPEGTGTQDGANIPVTPGTYDVEFNASTGKYKFTKKN